MQRKRVFISSVKSEFADERQILFDYLTSDALLGKFFEPFVFENIPALSASVLFFTDNGMKGCVTRCVTTSYATADNIKRKKQDTTHPQFS